jgi:hypothetical protein
MKTRASLVGDRKNGEGGVARLPGGEIASDTHTSMRHLQYSEFAGSGQGAICRKNEDFKGLNDFPTDFALPMVRGLYEVLGE